MIVGVYYGTVHLCVSKNVFLLHHNARNTQCQNISTVLHINFQVNLIP